MIMDVNSFRPVHVAIESVFFNARPVLRVVKADKQDIFDENTYARLMGSDFHNGTIELEVRSRLLPDAPDFARGFIGLVFRASENDAEFECYYVRPTNGNHPDPVRRAHGSQYFSYPGYTFSYFREHGIEGYEAPCDVGLDRWIPIKAVVRNGRAEFYVNSNTPTLVVEGLKHGPDARGAVGLYVDTGTEGFFRNLNITCDD